MTLWRKDNEMLDNLRTFRIHYLCSFCHGKRDGFRNIICVIVYVGGLAIGVIDERE